MRGGWRGGGYGNYGYRESQPAWMDDGDEDEFDESNLDGEGILRVSFSHSLHAKHVK